MARTSGGIAYRGHGLSFPFISFTHPSQWKARFGGYLAGPPYGPAHFYLIVALSTERLHHPDCHDVPQPDGTSREECSPILDALPPGGVYVEWWDNLSVIQPDSKLTTEPGNRTRIGGVFAKIVIDPTSATAGRTCPKETTGSVQVYIAGTRRTASGRGRGEVFMYACTNTTNFPRFMSQLLPMLRSVSFRKST